MAPCRQLLMWSVPSIAVLLGIFWFRKKREYAKSDPGGREKLKSLQEELADALNAEAEALKFTPLGKTDRSLIKSAPIDIIPNGIGSQRSSPLELTDEEVDLEIEKIIRKKSLKQSSSNDKQSIVMHSMRVEASFKIAASPPKQSTSLKTETSCTEVVNGVIATYDNEKKMVETTEVKQCVKDLSSASLDKGPQDHKVEVEEQNNNVNESGDSSFSIAQSTTRNNERDSANHSPMDPLLASPLCHFSDNHSDGSSDSGKGCSEAASPPPATLNMVPTENGIRVHQFVIPQFLVGLLIGKHGSFVSHIKSQTGATVNVRRHPDTVKQKICSIEGTQSSIEAALDMIREKFPEKRFPTLTLQEISAELYQKLIPLVPEFLQLVESVNNETILTCLVSAGHFFLQQPLHPTFNSLHALHRLMAATYQKPEVPPLPRPVKEGSICAAPTENNWYRAQVISTSEENDTSVVKLVDFGGYLTVGNDQLKQIRSDFMTLPFQATEAILAFVKPANNECEWSDEALRIMASLTAGQLLHAQVAGYDEAGLPLINLYLTIGAQQVIFLNQELVDRGLAVWEELPVDS